MVRKEVRMAACAAMALGMIALGGCGGGGQKPQPGHYTYRTTSDAPSTWSPTDWKMGAESSIFAFTSSSLYEFVMNEAKDGHDIVCEMAAAFPRDVTADYAGKAPYGVPAGATEGWAWHVELNPAACWEDGTPITAADYEYSLRQFLSPEMKNYRSTSFTKDGLIIANADGYYGGGASYAPVMSAPGTYADVPDGEMYVSLTQTVPFFGGSVEAAYAESPAEFGSGGSLYKKLEKLAGGATYAPLTAEMKDVLLEVSRAFGDENPLAYKEYCFTRKELPPVAWQDVGFIKEGDYAFTVVLGKALSPFMAMYNLGRIYLVKEDLYEANKKRTGDIVKSSYGTSKEKFASYGPYKIKSYQAEKSIQLEKNEAWYGWHDGARHHAVQTTDVDIQFIVEHATVLNLFLQGKLDITSLDATDLEKYGNSEWRVDEPQTYTAKMSFNIDKAALKREEAPGVNHSLIAYRDFRHAFSLCLDRRRYIDTVAPTSEPGYGIINGLYVAEPETGRSYRDTEEGRRVLCGFYGTESVADITGYDKEAARSLFQKAYEDAVAAGDLLPDDAVQVDVHISVATPTNVRTISFIQESVNAATEGTGLEGKVRLNQVIDDDYYNNMKKGKVDFAFTLWGGNPLDPYSMMSCYCDPDVLTEYGFHPDTEKVTLTVGGKELTRTYYEWYLALNQGEYANAAPGVRNAILSGLEGALLGNYNMIPYRYMYSSNLYSQRTENGSDHYVDVLVGFGGLSFLTYTMDDAEWDAYCRQNRNQLSY